ncbi:MAG: hypothetical protein ACTSQI_10240 [Candidatus Helarchaeota archaeon]
MDRDFEQIIDEIRKNQSLSLIHLQYLVDEFNDRFWRALRNLLSQGVKKYIFLPSNRIIWIVVGKTKDYLILSNLFCPCEDFYLNVVNRKSTKMCYHLLSKILAETLHFFEEIHVEDERYEELMKDWKKL